MNFGQQEREPHRTFAGLMRKFSPRVGWFWEAGWLCLSGVHASPAPSLQKNFHEDENLFFRSVTGLAIVGIARGHCIESSEGALGRTSLPPCNVGCAVTLGGILLCQR